MNFGIILLFLCFFFSESLIAKENKKDNDYKFSVNTGSFAYHLYNPKGNEYTEFFDNQFLAIGIKITDSTQIEIGTLINSYDDRCAFLGLEKKWYNFNSRLSFEGGYSYVGDFFLNSFDNCGNQGVYKKFKDITKIGFAPYIYHGIEYNITPILNLEAGFIIPSLAVMSIEWKF